MRGKNKLNKKYLTDYDTTKNNTDIYDARNDNFYYNIYCWVSLVV